jgi:hypothetical protein
VVAVVAWAVEEIAFDFYAERELEGRRDGWLAGQVGPVWAESGGGAMRRC